MIEEQDPLDNQLSGLPRVELDPWWVHSTRGAALRTLHAGARMPERPRSLAARYQPALLYALSAAQLLWAAVRVFASSH